MLKIKMITVAALEEKNHLWFIDRLGRPIRLGVRPDLLGMPNKAMQQKLIWGRVIKFQLYRLKRSAKDHQLGPWLKRAKIIEVSLRLRRKDQPRGEGHKQLDNWKSKTWKEASLRMVENAYNHARSSLCSPWERWVSQVAKNQHHRTRSRYVKSNHSVTNS